MEGMYIVTGVSFTVGIVRSFLQWSNLPVLFRSPTSINNKF